MEKRTNLDRILREAVDSPASGSVDGQSFTSHNLRDLIAMDRYLASKQALAGGGSGIRVMKLKGGSVND